MKAPIKNRAVLIIMDGYGIAPPTAGNAIAQAKKPNLDRLFARYPNSQLQASGLDVGLPAGQMGNSEVGHTNIGAGRVVFQILPKISKEIEEGTFFKNPVYLKAIHDAKENGKALHVLGLLSDGGVHSHLTHIFAMLDMAKREGVEKVFVHCFLDGRDVPPTSGAGFVRALQEKCEELGNTRIATVQGRFWGMDRDKRWDRVEAGYDAIVCGIGVQDPDAVHAVEASYAENVTDEFVKPIVACPEGMINAGDSVIFMNFRPDRAREMTWALNPHAAHRLSARRDRKYHRGSHQRAGAEAVPRRRDREVCACDLLLQRRCREADRRRGPLPGSLSERIRHL